MDSQKVFESIKSTISDIYKLYEYIGMSEKDYYNLVLREIKRSSGELTKGINNFDFLTDKIKTVLSDKVGCLIFNSKTSFYIINNYINQHFINIVDYRDAIGHLKKLEGFFEYYEFMPSVELLIKLISENCVLTETIELIMAQFYSQIVSGNMERIFDSEILISMIESYCTLKNIEIDVSNYYNSYVNDVDCVNDNLIDYLREIGKKPLLSVEQERELAQRVEKGDINAKNELIEHNLRLVVNIARRYQNRGLSFLDLIQEGNFGLMNVVDRYDVSKGYRFATYATSYIRKEITVAIANKSRNIRLPLYLYNKVNVYKGTVAKLSVELNRVPTDSEIADEMGLSISEVIDLQKNQNDTISSNMLVGDEDDTELGDLIPATDYVLEDVAMNDILHNEIMDLFKKCNLTDTEMKVLMFRYGFDGKDPMTLAEIGKQLGVTKQSVKQTEVRAINKLRKSEYIKDFAIYMQYPDSVLKNMERNIELGIKVSGIKTIYQYLNNYTREQINSMLVKLSEDELALITLRYGNDLDHPIRTKLTPEQRYAFYHQLVPKMRRLLKYPEKEDQEKVKRK